MTDAVTIRPGRKARGPDRWAEIVEAISYLLERRRPRLVVMEGLGFRSRTVALSAELSGIVRMHFYLQEIPYKLVSPAHLKKTVASKGNATKEEIAEAVFKKYGYRFEDDHQTDAFALAICEFKGLFVTKGIYDWNVLVRLL